MSFSLIIPVYGNEGGIRALLDAISALATEIEEPFDAVFVVDGSPDQSYAELSLMLPGCGFDATLVTLSRNFGAFAAIRAGLEMAKGEHLAVMAADLQEPPSLIVGFSRMLATGNFDVIFGVRQGRQDPAGSKFASMVFWKMYRALVLPEVPANGVDIFAMTRSFRDRLLTLGEANSSLLAQLFWLGGRRGYANYERRAREHGKSAWTLRKKFRYLSDSIFSFTDLPVRVLMASGAVGMLLAVTLGATTLLAKWLGYVDAPGYAGTLLTILFFGAMNLLGIGIIGTYAWRAYENTKARPLSIVQTTETFAKDAP